MGLDHRMHLDKLLRSSVVHYFKGSRIQHSWIPDDIDDDIVIRVSPNGWTSNHALQLLDVGIFSTLKAYRKLVRQNARRGAVYSAIINFFGSARKLEREYQITFLESGEEQACFRSTLTK